MARDDDDQRRQLPLRSEPAWMPRASNTEMRQRSRGGGAWRKNQWRSKTSGTSSEGTETSRRRARITPERSISRGSRPTINSFLLKVAGDSAMILHRWASPARPKPRRFQGNPRRRGSRPGIDWPAPDSTQRPCCSTKRLHRSSSPMYWMRTAGSHSASATWTGRSRPAAGRSNWRAFSRTRTRRPSSSST